MPAAVCLPVYFFLFVLIQMPTEVIIAPVLIVTKVHCDLYAAWSRLRPHVCRCSKLMGFAPTCTSLFLFYVLLLKLHVTFEMLPLLSPAIHFIYLSSFHYYFNNIIIFLGDRRDVQIRKKIEIILIEKKLILKILNTFKYHVSCTEGKISVRINLLFYVVVLSILILHYNMLY